MLLIGELKEEKVQHSQLKALFDRQERNLETARLEREVALDQVSLYYLFIFSLVSSTPMIEPRKGQPWIGILYNFLYNCLYMKLVW